MEERALLSTLPFSAADVSVTDVVSSVVDVSDFGGLDSSPAETLSVTQVDPAPGSTVVQSPTTLTVTFNLPIDPFSLGVDFALDQVNADGSLTRLDPDGSSGLVLEQGVLDSAPNSVSLLVTQPLVPGRYEIVLRSTSSLSGLDDFGNDVPWAPAVDFGADTPLGDFTVAVPGATLADAVSLGVVGASPVVTAGVLNLGADPSAVSLYQVTLGPGHFWTFGADVWASRIGSPLAATLSLFDAQGALIRTASAGLPSSPRDPYLFAGLAPGTYYVGVSGLGNTPGAVGGYDPAAGIGGSGIAQNGGAYQLHLAAVPDDSPPTVRGFQLQWADSRSTTPTGFTLSFSTWIDPNTYSSTHGRTFTGLDLVDQAGTAWGVTPIAFDSASGQITFLFDQKLPAGAYNLVLPESGGLTDLAGRAPVAQGEPAGVLATFTVAPSVTPAPPDDLGALTSSVHTGIDLGSDLGAGESVVYRMVVQVPDVYTLATGYSGGSLAVQLSDGNGLVSFDAGPAGQTTPILMSLIPGVYQLRFVASGSQPVKFHATFQEQPLSWEKPLENGIGQSAALNLLFVAPTEPVAAVPAPGAGGTAAGGSSSDLTAVGSVAAVAATVLTRGAAATPSSAPASPAGLVLTLGGTLAGAPSDVSGQAASVAMSSPSSDAGAPTANVAPQGQTGTPSNSAAGSSSADEAPEASADEQALPLVATASVHAELIPVSGEADARAVADSEWLGGVGARLAHWFARAPETAPETVAAEPNMRPASPERLALQRDDQALPEMEPAEKADLGMPLGIGLIALVAVRLREPVRRWWRSHTPSSADGTPARQGPHRNF